jgi:hypothetical protein
VHTLGPVLGADNHALYVDELGLSEIKLKELKDIGVI